MLATYKVTADFPKHELYGLTSQMRRAASSIPANIAEGCGRTGNGDLHRFLSTAMGSASELRYFLILARDLRFVSNEGYCFIREQVEEVQPMLSALIRKVEAARKLPKEP